MRAGLRRKRTNRYQSWRDSEEILRRAAQR